MVRRVVLLCNTKPINADNDDKIWSKRLLVSDLFWLTPNLFHIFEIWNRLGVAASPVHRRTLSVRGCVGLETDVLPRVGPASRVNDRLDATSIEVTGQFIEFRVRGGD